MLNVKTIVGLTNSVVIIKTQLFKDRLIGSATLVCFLRCQSMGKL